MCTSQQLLNTQLSTTTVTAENMALQQQLNTMILKVLWKTCRHCIFRAKMDAYGSTRQFLLAFLHFQSPLLFFIIEISTGTWLPRYKMSFQTSLTESYDPMTKFWLTRSRILCSSRELLFTGCLPISFFLLLFWLKVSARVKQKELFASRCGCHIWKRES